MKRVRGVIAFSFCLKASKVIKISQKRRVEYDKGHKKTENRKYFKKGIDKGREMW